MVLALRKEKKNEIIKSEVSCFHETELQINGVTKVMEKQINKYNSLPQERLFLYVFWFAFSKPKTS